MKLPENLIVQNLIGKNKTLNYSIPKNPSFERYFNTLLYKQIRKLIEFVLTLKTDFKVSTNEAESLIPLEPNFFWKISLNILEKIST